MLSCVPKHERLSWAFGEYTWVRGGSNRQEPQCCWVAVQLTNQQHTLSEVLEQKHTSEKVTQHSMCEYVVTQGSQDPNPVLLLGSVAQYHEFSVCIHFTEHSICK